MSRVHLIGGGWLTTATYAPFLADAAATRTAATTGTGAGPVIACIVLDEGDGPELFERSAAALRQQEPTCRPLRVLVPLGEDFDADALGDADGLLVCGGLTPGYADALVPVAAQIRNWLADGDRPYCGFSAGAAIASTSAIVGGWRSAGVPICPVDAAEDLDELTVVPGLGLIEWTIDVHCAQWGTLPRLVEAVRTRPAAGHGLGIDENTVVTMDADGRVTVRGLGQAWRVQRGGGRGAEVTPWRAGDPTI